VIDAIVAGFEDKVREPIIAHNVNYQMFSTWQEQLWELNGKSGVPLNWPPPATGNFGAR
jgi:hypothetical protein